MVGEEHTNRKCQKADGIMLGFMEDDTVKLVLKEPRDC